MTRILPMLILLIIAGCSTTQRSPNIGETKSPEKETAPFIGSYHVNRYLFDNGLRLLVIEDHSSPTFAYQTWFQVGSRDEAKGRTGLAHLFEHMMFKETKSLKDGEFDKLLESAGAEGENAFTSRDYTAYIQELPSKNLELIAKAEADRMENLVINQQAFQTEREVVQNERRFRNENSPDGIMDQELFSTAFTQHPYHWPIIGYQEDLNQMTAEDALKFYKTYYSPNHATVIVIGDVDSDQVASMVGKYYGHLPKQASPPLIIQTEPGQESARHKELKLNIQVEKLLMGYHIPGVTHQDMAALDVLQNILTGGKSSRLYKALVNTGIASSISSDGIEDKDPSLFVVSANMQKDKKAGEAEKVILKEFARISKQLISKQEVERAKNKTQFEFYESLSSNFEKAYFLGHYETISGDFKSGIDHHKRSQLVTAKEVREVAQKYLNPKNRTVIVGVQK